MIGYIDVGVMAYLKNLFPKYPVVWMVPEYARAALAKLGVNKQQTTPDLPPVNTIAVPGLSVFRTAAPLADWHSLPQAQRGWPDGKLASGQTDQGNYNFIQTVPIKAQYTIMAFASALSDLNEMEKRIRFADVYKVITTAIPAGNGTVNLEWPIYNEDDPIYGWEMKKETPEILFYNFRKTIRVDGVWAESYDIPPINSIVVDYDEITRGGSLITLESITLVSDKSDDTISIEPIGG